jgi:hypothetical protein
LDHCEEYLKTQHELSLGSTIERKAKRESKYTHNMPSKSTLTLPIAQSAPFALLALALFQNVPLNWVDGAEQTEVTMGDVKGVEAVRAELEKGIPGKEVSSSVLWFMRTGTVGGCRGT